MTDDPRPAGDLPHTSRPRSADGPIRIRPYCAGDARVLADICRRAVETIAPAYYSASQVAAWATRAPGSEQIDARATDGRWFLVAVDAANRPVAFGDLEPDGHIDLLYCAPEASGQGVAPAICDEIISLARTAGLTRLHVEASEAARRFFLRKGFVVVRRRDFDVGGVPIHNHAMETVLAPADVPDDATVPSVPDCPAER